ncbi:MAG: prolipoprotein diacylglyceryl transferase [Clostridiales bacterium]|nr:prolipoprotein diacylglyceryl transferase [Clostridiales bacterium]
MDNYTTVFFKGISRGFDVPSVAASFDIFGSHFTIKWYGVIIAFGFLLAVLWGGRCAYKWKMSIDKMLDVLIYGTFSGIVGARLYYCLFEWDYYGKHLTDIFKIWEGGLAIYGGLIGGLIGAYFTCKADKLNFLNLLDLTAMSFLIGQGIGRWGNFTNQEAFGTNTNLPWGMWSQKVADYISDNQALFAQKGLTVKAGTALEKAYVHPTFLYEFLWCVLSFIIIFIIYKKFRRFSGQLFLTYCALYGTGRAVIEGFRTDSLYIGGTNLRVSQLISIIIAFTSLVLLIVLTARYKKDPKPIEGVDFFREDESAKEKKEKKEEKKIKAKKESLFGDYVAAKADQNNAGEVSGTAEEAVETETAEYAEEAKEAEDAEEAKEAENTEGSDETAEDPDSSDADKINL